MHRPPITVSARKTEAQDDPLMTKTTEAAPPGEDLLLTSRQAADMLGLTEATLAQYRHAGNHPLVFIKLNHQVVRYRLRDIQKYLLTHTVRPRSKKRKQ